MSDSSRPHGLQPTRLLRPWDFQARVLEWGAIAFSSQPPESVRNKFFPVYKLSITVYNILLQKPEGTEPTNVNCGLWMNLSKLWELVMDRGRTRLSNFTFTFQFHALEEEMATHSSVLAWRIPGTGEPGGLPSVGSHRVGQD